MTHQIAADVVVFHEPAVVRDVAQHVLAHVFGELTG